MEPGFEANVGSEPSGKLPFGDAAFDAVFVPCLAGAAHGLRRTAAAAQFLAQCARVLKPGGRLVFPVPNPLVQRVIDAAGGLLRLAGPLAARGAGAYARLQLHRAARAPVPYAARGLRRLLQRSAFETVTTHAIWPRLDARDWLLPESGPWWRRRLDWAATQQGTLPRLAGALGTVPGRLVVARVRPDEGAGGAGAAGSVLATLLAGSGTSGPPDAAAAIKAQGGAVALVFSGDRFVKIALTRRESARQAAAIDAHAHLRTSAVREFVVGPERHGSIGAAVYTAFPRASQIRHRTDEERQHVQAQAFRALAADAELRPVDTTPAWSRMFAGESRHALERLGAGDLCAHMESSAAGRLVLAGYVHGHLSNLLMRDGRLAAIDWDLFEPDSPLIRDRCRGVYSLTTRRLGRSLGERTYPVFLSMLARRDPVLPLLHFIDEAAGELSWTHVVAMHVLNGISRRLLHYGQPSDRVERGIRQRLAFCRELIAADRGADTGASPRYTTPPQEHP
jgi:hypothetical protein